jgi:hypothetical protein
VVSASSAVPIPGGGTARAARLTEEFLDGAEVRKTSDSTEDGRKAEEGAAEPVSKDQYRPPGMLEESRRGNESGAMEGCLGCDPGIAPSLRDPTRPMFPQGNADG